MDKLKQEWYANLPKKRMAAGVLLFDNKRRLLIVKPSYKTGWIIPGGIVEKNESPRRAVIREVGEEIGLVIKRADMVVLDYVSAAGGKDENLQFIFFGGTLLAKEIRQIRLQEEELVDHKFVSTVSAVKLLRKKIARRLPHCLRAVATKSCVYLENGSLVN